MCLQDIPDLFGLSLEHTVFEDITSLFESMEGDMIRTACHYVFVDVQARSQPYRKDRWELTKNEDRPVFMVNNITGNMLS